MFRSQKTTTVLTALLLLAIATCAPAQMTVSARPGLLNYFEGDAFLNGNPLALGQHPPVFLNANDTFAMGTGKAEILLMPGVFLRVGDGSRLVMLSPSLVDTRLEMVEGEAILEAVFMVRGSRVQIEDGGALITITGNGLYRIRAGGTPAAAVFQGLAEVTLGNETIKVHRGRQTALTANLKSEKLDTSEDDELYAWSSVRSQYEAAASYASATAMAANNQTATSGWYYNDTFDVWAWLSNGVFFSPFGWGFYSPALVSGATVIRCPVASGGHWHKYPLPKPGSNPTHREWVGIGATRVIPINPKHPPALGVVAGSPQQERIVRSSPDNGAQFTRFRANQLSASGEVKPQSPSSGVGRAIGRIFNHQGSDSRNLANGGGRASAGNGHGFGSSSGHGGFHGGSGTSRSGGFSGDGGGHASGGSSGGGGARGGGGSSGGSSSSSSGSHH